MKKLLLSFVLMVFTLTVWAADSPKYIFYFIGDGMGVNIVNATEAYLADNEGRIGNKKLAFAQLPYSGFATTYCATRYITDSAAAGTALASGVKTSPGTIGMNSDYTENVESLAFELQRRGMAIGILSSVSIDHATPASFYANQPKRGMANQIAYDAVEAGFDLYGGSGLLKPVSEKGNVYDEFAKNGYTRVKGKQELTKGLDSTTKYIITERDSASVDCLDYRIDRSDVSMTLKQMVEHSIPYLKSRGGKDGFFMMVEGGAIDWAAHSNDGAAAVGEVISFDDAFRVALEFYNKHPKETLIVVTADHETGGFGLGTSTMGYKNNFKLIDAQKVSYDILQKKVKRCNGDWDAVYGVLSEQLGFGTKLILKQSQIDALESLNENRPNRVAKEAIYILNDYSGFGWTTVSHTGSPVPVFSIGVGADKFAGRIDNTDIPKRMLMIHGK